MTSEYRASGEAAVLIHALEQVEREEREYRRWLERQEWDRGRERQAELDELVADVRALAAEALVAAGCYQHKGEWRKRRGERNREARNPAGGGRGERAGSGSADH